MNNTIVLDDHDCLHVDFEIVSGVRSPASVGLKTFSNIVGYVQRVYRAMQPIQWSIAYAENMTIRSACTDANSKLILEDTFPTDLGNGKLHTSFDIGDLEAIVLCGELPKVCKGDQVIADWKKGCILDIIFKRCNNAARNIVGKVVPNLSLPVPNQEALNELCEALQDVYYMVVYYLVATILMIPKYWRNNTKRSKGFFGRFVMSEVRNMITQSSSKTEPCSDVIAFEKYVPIFHQQYNQLMRIAEIIERVIKSDYPGEWVKEAKYDVKGSVRNDEIISIANNYLNEIDSSIKRIQQRRSQNIGQRDQRWEHSLKKKQRICNRARLGLNTKEVRMPGDVIRARVF